MKRLICLLLCMLLTGNQFATASGREVTFRDDLGREVTVTETERTAVLLGSFAEIWMLSGGSVCATADDAWEDYRLPLKEGTVNLGNTKKLSLELLLASDPDFIIASKNTEQHLEWLEVFDKIGIPVAYFDVSDFDGYLNMLEICTEITGRKDLYQINGVQISEQVKAITERCRGKSKNTGSPSVLLLRYSASSVRAKNSEGNIPGEMLESLGCVNIADSDAMLLENLSFESIIEEDPDYIFLVQQGNSATDAGEYLQRMLNENPAWEMLTAVKTGHVFQLDRLLFGLKPNNRWAEALEILEKDIFCNEDE